MSGDRGSVLRELYLNLPDVAIFACDEEFLCHAVPYNRVDLRLGLEQTHWVDALIVCWMLLYDEDITGSGDDRETGSIRTCFDIRDRIMVNFGCAEQEETSFIEEQPAYDAVGETSDDYSRVRVVSCVW